MWLLLWSWYNHIVQTIGKLFVHKIFMIMLRPWYIISPYFSRKIIMLKLFLSLCNLFVEFMLIFDDNMCNRYFNFLIIFYIQSKSLENIVLIYVNYVKLKSIGYYISTVEWKWVGVHCCSKTMLLSDSDP